MPYSYHRDKGPRTKARTWARDDQYLGPYADVPRYCHARSRKARSVIYASESGWNNFLRGYKSKDLTRNRGDGHYRP